MKTFKVIRPYDEVPVAVKQRPKAGPPVVPAPGAIPTIALTATEHINPKFDCRTWKFDSSKGVKDKYTVICHPNGALTCNCLGWGVMKGKTRTCQHTHEIWKRHR